MDDNDQQPAGAANSQGAPRQGDGQAKQSRDALAAWMRRSPLVNGEDRVFERQGGLTREIDW